MLYDPKPIDEIMDQMRSMGELLVPYNFPKADPRLENDLNILKTVDCIVDGYSICLHFSKADYDAHYLETLQVLGKDIPFLPFCLIVKLARKFLGGHNLSLVELLKGNRKIYCWTLTVDRRGRPLPAIHEVESETCVYEGFEYSYLDPATVNFY